MAVAYEHSNEGAKLTAMQGCELTASFDASVKEGGEWRGCIVAPQWKRDFDDHKLLMGLL